MSLAAGDLNRRITIEARTTQRDQQTGSVEYSWAKITNGDDWASIQPLSTREFVAAAAVQSKVSARIILRYRPDVTAAMRIVDEDGAIYSIEGPPLRDRDTGREYMTLAVSQGVNAGA